MLVQHPGLPFFTVAAGDYYPSSSAPSTPPQTTHLPGGAFAIFGLTPPNTSSTPTATIKNNNSKTVGGVINQPPSQFKLTSRHMVVSDFTRQELKQNLVSPTEKCPQPAFRQSYPTIEKNRNSHNSAVSATMPRQHSHAKVNQVGVKDGADGLVFPGPPPRPIAAGGKRDATALSGNAAVPNVTGNNTTVVPLDSGDQPSMRLPPKMKETERMMHVQRWVNHLPIPVGGDRVPSSASGIWCYSVPLPGYSHIDEDRELTPPPSKPYLTRLPFTLEEHQTMLRVFPSSGNSHEPRYQHHISSQQQPQQAGAAGSGLPPYSSGNNQPQQQLTYGNQRVLPPHNSNQQAHHHIAISAQRSNHHQQPAATTGSGAVGHQKHVSHRLEQQDCDTGGRPSGTRFFAEWETRLISRLFQEYFPGGPDGNVTALNHPISSTLLPSVSEVRARIASSRLKDTRTATAVRAKIKRMLSSGSWADFQ